MKLIDILKVSVCLFNRIVSFCFISLPKWVAIILVFIFITGYQLFAQTSKNNNTGDWTSGSTWIGGTAPTTTLGGGVNVTINGYVTLTGNLTLSGGSITLNDTLVIKGDLILNAGSTFNNQAGGVLIVRGNFTNNGGMTYSNGGTTIVTGNFVNTGSYNNNGSQSTYLYDATPTLGSTNGMNCGSGGNLKTNSGCQYGNYTDAVSSSYGAFIASTASTLYSYQSGAWDDPSVWTTDPGGSTLVGSKVPGAGDVVVILPSRTVTLRHGNVATTGLDITIQSAGVLDDSTYSFNSTLSALRGQGTLKLKTASFPSVALNTFVQSGGGTVEYYNGANFTLPTAQTTYNNLTLNCSGATATQISDITLNGNLYVKTGTYQINDNTSARRKLIVNGNVTVDNGAAIKVGTGVTNTQTSPYGINSSSNITPFIEYYESQSHHIELYGDLINNGTVKFTNLAYPVYNAFPSTTQSATSGFATVYFRGTNDNKLTCNGTTDFYNLVLDKGIDQTYKLTVYSTAYSNFRLFGANTAGGDNNGTNPNLKKALWIRNGSFVLQGLAIIPSLTEGDCSDGASPNSDFYIPANGALVLDGPDVVVLTTADDYREINVAYNVAGASNSAVGVADGTHSNCSSFSIYGRIQVNNGYISTRESGGFITWDQAAGQFIINGGVVDAKQFRAAGGASGLASFTQTGGLFILRGRFQRTPSAYSTISNLTDISTTTLNTVRPNNEGYLNGSLGAFNINASANVFTMSGGTIRIYDACGTGGMAFQVNSSTSNINVTGGNVELIPTHGTGQSADASNLLISSSAPIGSLLVNRASGPAGAQLNTNPLTVLGTVTLTSGSLDANNLDLTVGGNFSVAGGTTYNSGTNTTTFNGTSNQVFTINGVVNNGSAGLNNMVINKTSGTLSLLGSQASLTVQGTFDLTNGAFDDGGKTVYIAGNMTNSGTHFGTGEIQLNGTSAQTIGGNGTGIFQNLELNNNNSVINSVTLSANQTINGILTFTRDKVFDIKNYNLTLGASSSLVGVHSGTYGYIQTNGDVGDGGVSKVYNSAASFTYPVGAFSTVRTATYAYTPATIGLSSAPTSNGAITVIPVGMEHPNTDAGTKTVSLAYFWRVKSSGISPSTNSVNFSFTYADADVQTSNGAKETNYIPARYDRSSYSWNTGVAADIITTTNVISWPLTANVIDGDYTAGDGPKNPFKAPTIYYSYVNNGNYDSKDTWSTTGHTGVQSKPAKAPGANDPVIIGNGHTILAGANTQKAATLQITAGSTLDLQSYTGHAFGMTNGTGTIRISSSSSPAVFPSGDFSEFTGANGGTVEYYTSGTNFTIPTTNSTYKNLVLNPATGEIITMPDQNMLIYGNMSVGTGTGSAYLNSGGNSRTLTINGNLNVNNGTLQFRNGAAQTVNVIGDVNVANNAYFNVRNSSSLTHFLNISGNLTNNGTVNFDRGSDCSLTFIGSNNTSLTGTGSGGTTLYNLIVNKGTSQATTLTLDVAGTLTTPTDNWLTLQNGTFKYMKGATLPVTTSSTFTIPATACFHVENASAVVNVANNGSNNNDLYLNGKIKVVSGALNVGNSSNNNNNDIEYSGGGTSEIEVMGGTLMVNGQIRRNPATSAGILTYTQSGGAVSINGRNAISTNAKLEILNSGSSFNMSGGTLTIVRSGGGSTFGDLYLRPENGSATGGEIIFTNVTPASAQTYLLDATVPLNNLTITSKDNSNKSTVKLLVSPLTLNGTLKINPNSIFDANNLYNIDVTIKGDLYNDGTYNHYNNTTTFNAGASNNAGAQSITGASSTDFYDLLVNSVTSLTLSKSVTVNNDLTISSGTLICGTYNVNAKGDVTNNATYTNTGTGGLILNGTALQHLAGLGTFGRMELNNATGAKLDNAITIQNGNLVLTSGIFNINQYLLTLGTASVIEGSSFSSSKMIVTDGVYSNVGVRKYFPVGVTTFTYPIGVSGKYAPADLTITANESVGFIRVNPINAHHPAVTDPANVLKYYWEVESSGVSNFSGNIKFYYQQADVQGTQETSYVPVRLAGGTTWDKKPTDPRWVVDASLNTILWTYLTGSPSDISGEYTAGIVSAFPDNIPIYKSNKDGSWTDKTIWTPVAPTVDPCPNNGPNGYIVIVNNEVTVSADNCYAYHTTINGTLKIKNGTEGHNFGLVDGSGTLYMENGQLPAGRFTTFLDCANNGTLEYGGDGSYTLIADRLDQIPNLVFSGKGSRILPDKDLTICNLLKINGSRLDNSVNNRKLTILGTMTLGASAGSFKSGSGSNATVEFAGVSAQTLGSSSSLNFTDTCAFNNLVVNNSQGVTLGGAVEVKGSLYLTAGIVTTSSSNILTITNTATNCVTPAGGSSSSFINGPLAKKINQGDGFSFPIGKSGKLGNLLTLSSARTGTLVWTGEYFTPNGTASSITTPLTAVDPDSYWTVSAPGSTNQALVTIGWQPSSGLTPLMTLNGVSDMTIAEYNTDSWQSVASTATGDNYNGTVNTDALYTFSNGSRNFTIGSKNTLKPRAKLSPLGAICGDTGIPVTFTSAVAINLNYTLSYTVDGGATQSVTVSSLPYTLPTGTSGGAYKLTGFTYNGGSGTGVVDNTSVTTYTKPNPANAGSDQLGNCGLTSTALVANAASSPSSGLWSIVSGTGGSFVSPTSQTSTFNGINGSSYTLRWTISNGGCSSSDDMVVKFSINPSTPASFVASSSSVCAGSNSVTYTVPSDASVSSFLWGYSNLGNVTFSGSGNSVVASFAASATSGTLSVASVNGCGTSSALSLPITVNPIPTITLGTSPSICKGSTIVGLPYTSISGSPSLYSLIYDSTAKLAGLTDVSDGTFPSSSPLNIAVSSSLATGTFNGSLSLKSAAGCSSSSYPFTITVNPLPTTGPAYRLPNN